MSDVAALANELYRRFVLRDFLGKVIPGSLLLLTLLHSFAPGIAGYFGIRSADGAGMLTIPGWCWLFGGILFTGFAWVLGLAAQSFAEMIRQSGYYPRRLRRDRWGTVKLDKSTSSANSCEPNRAPSPDHAGGSKLDKLSWDETDYEWKLALEEFSTLSDPDGFRGQKMERYIVITEASRNVAWSVALSLLLFATRALFSNQSQTDVLFCDHWPALLFIGIFAFLLWRISVRQADRQLNLILAALHISRDLQIRDQKTTQSI